MAHRIADRYRCGITVRIPLGCMTRTEACEKLKVGYWRFRGLSTKPRVIRHPMPRGPHCHRIALVPEPLAEFLARRLPYEKGAAIPYAAITEAFQADTIGARLFANWAVEHNARIIAGLSRDVGMRAQATSLQRRAAIVRQARERMVKAIIAVVETRIPENRP